MSKKWSICTITLLNNLGQISELCSVLKKKQKNSTRHKVIKARLNMIENHMNATQAAL